MSFEMYVTRVTAPGDQSGPAQVQPSTERRQVASSSILLPSIIRRVAHISNYNKRWVRSLRPAPGPSADVHFPGRSLLGHGRPPTPCERKVSDWPHRRWLQIISALRRTMITEVFAPPFSRKPPTKAETSR